MKPLFMASKSSFEEIMDDMLLREGIDPSQ